MNALQREITINGQNLCCDFSALLAKKEESLPEIISITETVPYSEKVYVFTELMNKRVLSHRTVTYYFKFCNASAELNQYFSTNFVNFLYSLEGEIEIFDNEIIDYHYVGRLVSVEEVDTVGIEFGAKMIKAEFSCDPRKKPNSIREYTKDDVVFPDVDGDGVVNAYDASLIQQAASNIGAGYPSGLTPEQEILADANMDGVINTMDASLVSQFGTAVGARKFSNSPEGWAKFLSSGLPQDEGII